MSLEGKSDFHVLEALGSRVYGFGSDFETRRAQFLVSGDRGSRWEERRVPEPLVSLALSPDDADRLVASGGRALYGSNDGGRRWSRLGSTPGLVAWPAARRLYRVGVDGRVEMSGDGGRRWRERGAVGSQPAAFEAEGPADLYVALHDGTVQRSTDGGATWRVRSKP